MERYTNWIKRNYITILMIIIPVCVLIFSHLKIFSHFPWDRAMPHEDKQMWIVVLIFTIIYLILGILQLRKMDDHIYEHRLSDANQNIANSMGGVSRDDAYVPLKRDFPRQWKRDHPESN